MEEESQFQVGAQVLVNSKYKATVRYVGLVSFAEGLWYGVELDRPVGKHDGTVLQRVYFRTAPKHGTFVRKESLSAYTAEGEAASKLGSVMKMSIAKRKAKGEVLFRAFNTLEYSDESAVLARRQALMNSALGSKLTRDRPTPEQISDWEKEAMAMPVPADYSGPHLSFPLKVEEVVAMLGAFRRGEVLHYKYALQLIIQYARYAGELPTLVPVTVEHGTRLTIVGDTHGQLNDLLSIFTLNGVPSPTNRYLINGDFVDRGPNSVEIILSIFAFCMLYPGAKGTSAGGGCLLNRGNHESHNQNLTGGLFAEMLDKYASYASASLLSAGGLDTELGLKLYDSLQLAFDNMPLVHIISSAASAAPAPASTTSATTTAGSVGSPLAISAGSSSTPTSSSMTVGSSPMSSPMSTARTATTARGSMGGGNSGGGGGGGGGASTPGRRIFVVHGGLMQHPGVTLNAIASINRKREIPYGSPLYEDHIFESLQWSDPRTPNGTTPSDRGAGCFFGPDVTERFCKLNGLSLIVRSHECVQEGYSLMHDNRVLTVFSASKYCGRGNNRGSFVTFSPTLRHRVVQYTAPPLASEVLKPSFEPPAFLNSPTGGGSGGNAAGTSVIMMSPNPRSPTPAAPAAPAAPYTLTPADQEVLRAFDCVVAIPNAMLSERGSVPGLINTIPGVDLPPGPKIEDGVAAGYSPRLASSSSSSSHSHSAASSAASEGVRKMLMERVVLNRAELYAHWAKLPSQLTGHQDGCITRLEWAEGMRKVLKIDLPWVSLAPILCVFEEGSNNTRINYSRFLDRYRIAAVGDAATQWMDALISQICQKLFKTCGSLEAAFSALDVDGSGEISLIELENGLSKLNLGITKAQIVDLINALDKDHSGAVSWAEFESRFRLFFSKLHDDEAAGQRKNPPPRPGQQQGAHLRVSSTSSRASSTASGGGSSGRSTPGSGGITLDPWAKDTLRKIGAALFGTPEEEPVTPTPSPPGSVSSSLPHDPASMTPSPRPYTLTGGGGDIREAFRLIDINRDGLLSQEELLVAVQKLNLGYTEDDVSRLLAAIDSNASGWINYTEWCEAFAAAGVIQAPAGPSMMMMQDSMPLTGLASPSPVMGAGHGSPRTSGITPPGGASTGVSGSPRQFSSPKSPGNKGSSPSSTAGGNVAAWHNRDGAIDSIMALLYEFRCELGAAFKLFDVDGNGTIDKAEFRQGLRALQALSATSAAATASSGGGGSSLPVLSDEAADAIMDSLDADGNGTISFQEFVNGFQLVDEGPELDSAAATY